MLSVVLGDDPIPRFSRVNMANLAQEVRAFAPIAETWKRQDIECFKRYTKKYGRASTPTPLAHTTEALAGVKTAVVAAGNTTANAAAMVANRTTQATVAVANATVASATAVVGRVRGATLTSSEPPQFVDVGEHINMKNPLHPQGSRSGSITAASSGFAGAAAGAGAAGYSPGGVNIASEGVLFIDEDMGGDDVNIDVDGPFTGRSDGIQVVHAQSSVGDQELLDDIDCSGLGNLPADPLGAGFVRLVPPGVIIHMHKKHGK